MIGPSRAAALLALLALFALGAATRLQAQQSIQVEGPRRLKATMIVRSALATPHDVVITDSIRRLILPAGTVVPRTLVVLGGDASVGATVRGDIIVVGGDLFLSPGALIEGKAIAVGGGVYGSTLAKVSEGTESIRDHTFDVTQTGESIRLDYRYVGGREPKLELPLIEGLRIPSYDRVDGVSVPWGPIFRPTVKLELDPTVTYRSHLGAWDPGLRATLKSTTRDHLTLDVRRTTLNNDAWIYSDLINSFNTIVDGGDTRNYYRADRGELEFRRFDQYVQPNVELERFAGVAVERAWSVGSLDTLGSRPWVVTGRGDPENIARPNPTVTRGRISSAFVGASVRYRLGDVRMTGTGRIEVPWESPRDARFGQLTFDGGIQFPTFGLQRFRSDLHLVTTVGDTAPPQRFAYLGGSGTLPVMKVPLEMGGDQLLHLDSRYEIPLQRIRLPLAGSPTVSVRHRLGSAGVQELPRFVQNLGVLLTLSFAKVEYTIDPATRDDKFSVGLSFAR